MTEAKNIFTYQGRLYELAADQSEALDAYAEHYNHVERRLYTDMRKSGASAASFKNSYLVEYGLTARQFNAIGRNLEGKIASVKELLPLRRGDLAAKIEKLSKALPKIKDIGKLHQKKRRLAILEGRLAAVDAQLASGDPQICFGSRKLFLAQHNLEINGFLNHEEWRAAWQSKRNSQFFVIGSGDETMGCQGCVISANPDGSFNLKLRLLGKEASYAVIENLSIPYGGDVIRSAVERHRTIQTAYTLELKEARGAAKAAPEDPAVPSKKPLGPSLSYRFLKDAKGWRVFISTEFPKVEIVSVKAAGAVGIDINADCIALAETDRFGNLVGTQVFPLVTYGKSSDQAEAIIGDVVKEIVARAVDAGKPVIMEKLDFSKKKAELNGEDPKYARMLSSLTYNGIKSGIKARASKHGIEVIEVNPAYSSIIGLVNYTQAKGLSVHQAAALVIARRGSGFRERPFVSSATIPTSKGDHVTFPLPARIVGKHVWTFWRASQTSTKTVLVAHARSSSDDPSRLRPWKGKYPAFMVRPRDVNRSQHCSESVLGIIPW